MGHGGTRTFTARWARLGMLGVGACALLACEATALRGLGFTSGSDLYGDVQVGNQGDFGVLKGVEHIHACQGGVMECKGSLTLGHAPIVGGLVGQVLKLANATGDGPSDISSLADMQSLKSVEGDLTLDQTQLPDLKQLPRGMTVGGKLSVLSNGELATLDGVDTLGHVGSDILVVDNGGLEGIPGIPQQYVDIVLSQLLKLDGVSLAIQHNGPLKSIKALPPITKVKGHVQIAMNSNLVTLEGLGSLQEIGGNLLVLGNPVLESLDALSSLTTIHGDLKIQVNPVLLQHPDRLQAFLARVHVEGNTTLDLNLDGGFPFNLDGGFPFNLDGGFSVCPDGGYPPGFDAGISCP